MTTKLLTRFAFVAVFALVLAGSALAQVTATTPAGPEIKIGETLVYEANFSKIIPGMAVADLTFNVEQVPNSENYLVRTRAVSKGTLIKLFRYSFLQEYQSIFERNTRRVLKTTKHDVQKDRVRDSEATFDYETGRVIYTETDPTDPNRAPRLIASEITLPMQDMVTGIYSIRAMPLAVGRKFTVLISDSGLVYTIPVLVTAREQQNTIFGKIWTYRIEPQIFGKGRMIERSGSMVMWITDDDRRLPVRARIKTSIGKIDIKLRSATNPLDPSGDVRDN